MSFVAPSPDGRSSGAAYEGWLYHVGVSSLGYQFCRSRYLIIKGKRVEMYTCNPHEKPSKPVRCGIVGSNMMVEELGRQIFHSRALYVLRIYSLLDRNKQGKLACSCAGEAQKWLAAFQHAKEESVCENGKGNVRTMLKTEEEFRLTGSSRYRPRPSLKFPRQSVKIGRGPESLLLRPSMVAQDPDDVDNMMLISKHHESDTVEQENWKCIMTVNGLRIFEGISSAKDGKNSRFLKSVGVVDATPDQAFDMVMTLDKNQRQQWDVLSGDLVLVEGVDGHSDIAYGVYDPKFYRRWCLKKDFLFLRRWRHDQDGSFCITEESAVHKKCPRKFCHRRVKLNPTVWEISPLPSRDGTPRSRVTQIMEIKGTGCKLRQKLYPPKFQMTTPYFLLCRTAGLREFFAASSEAAGDMEPVDLCPSVLSPEGDSMPQTIPEGQAPEVNEQFYDAIALEDLSGEEDAEPQVPLLRKSKGSVLNRSSSWTVRLGLPSKRPPCREDNSELVLSAAPVDIDISLCKTSLRQGHNDTDSDCWSNPGGQGFMVRGRTYINDNLKVPGGDPLLELLGVDWLRHEKKIDLVARHPRSLVKSNAVKKLPFVLVFNLQIPAKPNYSLVFYYGAHKPIRPGSLLDKFVNGDDAFRNSRLKLIPRIVEGYWVVKRAVGTKACLLGRALSCNYFKEDNFLEIDVDVGSSSVARSVCGLVLNYATSVVIDFAMLIEGVDEVELPEYLLGASRIHRINPASALPVENL